MVPDPEHGFVPVASSHQLRVLGAILAVPAKA
jgi:hypothetical protein